MTTWIMAVYIVLLLAGGLVGYLKAGSRVSLVMAAGFAVAMTVCVWGPVPGGVGVAQAMQGLLAIVFAVRCVKTKKFMPAGLMLAVTVIAIGLELIVGR